MPSFHPRNGFSSEDSTIAGRTTAMAAEGFCVEEIANQRFGEALREGVSIGPAEFVGAVRSSVGESLTQPADAIFADLIFERSAVEIFRGMFFFQRRAAQFFSHFLRFGAGFRLANQIFERLPFLHGIVISDPTRVVVSRQFFEHAAVALADDVAGGKMQQGSMLAFAQEIRARTQWRGRWSPAHRAGRD